MGRRRRSHRKPRRGPGHNEANRQTRESRQRSLKLDQGREAHFRYDVEEALTAIGMLPEEQRPFLQTLWTRGTRQGVEEAKKWVQEARDNGELDEPTQKRILQLIKRYSAMS